jgi:hypothetical protein
MGVINMGDKVKKPEKNNDVTELMRREDSSTIWDNLIAENSKHTEDLQKQMTAFGYSKGEIERTLKTKLSNKKKDRVEELKEELYIRHKLRYRLLMDHTRDVNLLATLENMRQEDQHIIDSLIKLGDIAPIQQNPTNVIQTLGIEQFVYSAFKADTGQAPILKEAPPAIEEPENE